MPLYLYQHPKTKKVVEVIQKMAEKHEYVKNGVSWKRVWLKPRMSVDAAPIDPFNAKDFVKATNKKATIGELHDRSAEMSQRRIDKDGIDHIKEAHYDSYEKAHKGQMHPQRKREKGAEKLKDAGISVDWGD